MLPESVLGTLAILGTVLIVDDDARLMKGSWRESHKKSV
jgi:hypothetical protein